MDVGRTLAPWRAVAEQRPARTALARLGVRQAVVVAVVPLDQVLDGGGLIGVAKQGACLARTDLRRDEYDGKLSAVQQFAGALGRRAPAAIELNLRTPGVAPSLAPVRRPVTDKP